MNSSFLSWKITKGEKKERVQKLIFRVGIPLAILGIISATVGFPEHSTYQLLTKGIGFIIQKTIYVIIGISAGLMIFLLLNKVIPYKERSYNMDENGIVISKGRKTRKYTWSDFEFFYPFSERSPVVKSDDINKLQYVGQDYRNKIFESDRELEGDIFYLKKKSRNFFFRLCRNFVVIYAEPDNSKAVSKFLSRHLERKNMKATSDLGLVDYEFK